MSKASVIAKAKGLYTHPSPIGESIPEGALLVADNVVIDREDLVEIRRGFYRHASIPGATSVQSLFGFGAYNIANYNFSSLAHNASGAYVAYSGSYSPPFHSSILNFKMKSAQAQKNFYFTEITGIKKLDSISATPVNAGAPKALGGTGATSGVTGWMTNAVQVAYRIVWGIKDANSNKILGAPSERIIVSNSSGTTANVALTFSIPAEITTSHFYQVYRSGMTAALTDEPTDELQLIVEANPSGADIIAKSITYADETPDDMRGATLYTSPSQQGIAKANDRPPLAMDIAVYKGQMLYANTKTAHRMFITMISIGGTVGLVNDDTITIDGVTYTGKSAENVAAAQFKITTGGTVSQNIDATAKSLIRVINGYSGNVTVYAYYLSGFSDLPGQIFIESRSPSSTATSFYATSSRGGAFSPALPSSGTSYASDAEIKPNRVYVSKPGQPEAVPLLNYIDIGSGLSNIIRIVALRSSWFALKEDGIFRVTGETIDDFRVDEFDRTTKITAPNTVLELNNAVFGLSNQGVVRISDSGVEIVSRPIERTIRTLDASGLASLVSFAMASETDRLYILAMPSTTTDSLGCRQQFVYNALAQAWTRWTVPMTCGGVFSTNGDIFVASLDSPGSILRQLRTSGPQDYADGVSGSFSIMSVSGKSVELTSTTGISAGQTLAQLTPSSRVKYQSVIVSVDDATRVTVRDALTWDFGSAAVYIPIAARIRWSPLHSGNPALLKQNAWCAFLFAGADFDYITSRFSSDKSASIDEITLIPFDLMAWGEEEFGGDDEIPFGGGNADTQMIAVKVPDEKQVSNWLNVELYANQALRYLAVSGLALYPEQVQNVPAQR